MATLLPAVTLLFLYEILLFWLSFSLYFNRETPQSSEIIEEMLFASKHQPRGPSGNQTRKCSMKDIIKHGL